MKSNSLKAAGVYKVLMIEGFYDVVSQRWLQRHLSICWSKQRLLTTLCNQLYHALMEHAHGELFEVLRILDSCCNQNSRTNSRCCERCSKDGDWRVEVERSESKELSLSSYWSFNLGDNSLQRYLQAYLGFHEQEISRINKDKDAATSGTSSRIQIASNEISGVSYRIFLTDDGSCPQDADPRLQDGGCHRCWEDSSVPDTKI